MSHNVSSGLIMSHQVSSCLIRSHQVFPCLIRSHHVSSCLTMSHHLSSGLIRSFHVSSCLIRSHQVFPCLLLSHHILMHLMSSYLIVSHRISFALVSSHHFHACHMSRHFPQSSRLFKSAENHGKPQWHCIAFGSHAFVHLRPQVPRGHPLLYRILVRIQGISRNIQSVWDRMLRRWAGNPGFRASEITAAFLKMQMTKAPIMVLFLNMDETQWNHPLQTSFLKHIWYYVLIVLLVVNLCCACCCLALRVNSTSDSSESVRTVLG